MDDAITTRIRDFQLDSLRLNNLEQSHNDHLVSQAPHQYGNRFMWQYNPASDSLDLVVLDD